MGIKKRTIYRLYNLKKPLLIKKYPIHHFALAVAVPAVAIIVAIAPTQATTNGLIGEWKLDEGSGSTVTDTSGNGNNGTIVRGTGTGSPTWVSPGHDAGLPHALDFDGTDNGVETNTVNLGNSPILDQLDNYTVSLWVKFKPGYVGNGGTWANLVGRNSSGGDWAWMIYVNNSGHIRPHHRNSDGSYAPLTDSANSMPVGQWVHIEQIADGSSLHLYINGQEDANFPITYSGTTMSLPTANTYIGQDTREFAPLATISDVKIYNNALIAPQTTTGTTTGVGKTIATLHGTLNSLGDFTPVNGFFRYRVAGSNGAYSESSPQAMTSPGQFTANISGLAAATQYEFQSVVQWQGRDGTQDAAGSLVNFTTDPLGAPSAVTALQAVSAGTDRINLTWDAPVDTGGSPITGYKIERSPDASSWQTIVATTGNASTAYSDTGLAANTKYYYRVSAINIAGTGLVSNVANATTDMPDDHDGVPRSTEDAAPNGGDGNNDGAPDSQEPNVASFVDAQTGKYVTLALPGTCAITSASTATESANTKADEGYNYPAGMLDYTANCGTPGSSTNAKVYFYSQSEDGLTLRKYNPTGKTYATISDANISQTSIGGQTAVLASYTVVDGGALDTDGVANGTIVDPVGLARTTSNLTNTGTKVLLAGGLAITLLTGGVLVWTKKLPLHSS